MWTHLFHHKGRDALRAARNFQPRRAQTPKQGLSSAHTTAQKSSAALISAAFNFRSSSPSPLVKMISRAHADASGDVPDTFWGVDTVVSAAGHFLRVWTLVYQAPGEVDKVSAPLYHLGQDGTAIPPGLRIADIFRGRRR